MINATAEQLFEIRSVPRVLVGMGVLGRNGSPLHRSVIYRWIGEGLETLQVGGRKFTSREALIRFFDSRTQLGRRQRPPLNNSVAEAAAVSAGEHLRNTIFRRRMRQLGGAK